MPRTAWLRDVPDLWRREPMLTGRVGGALYIGAGLYALLLLVLPGTTLTHLGLVAPLGAASVVYGLLSIFVLDWRTLPAWVLPTGTLAALVSTALSIYATGGFDSPVEQVPVFVVVYSACFLSSRFTLSASSAPSPSTSCRSSTTPTPAPRASERTRSARCSSSARWPSSSSSGACCWRASPRSTP